MQLAFEKYHGLGNDFIIIAQQNWRLALAQTEEKEVELAKRLCDRHRGIGGDGVLLVDSERPAMRVINSDGSTPEMCGNGLRCVALHLANERTQSSSAEFEVLTDAGPHLCRLSGSSNQEGMSISISMRYPSFEPASIPVVAQQAVIDTDWEVQLADNTQSQITLTAVSMGNPHAVLFDTDAGNAPAIAQALSEDERFLEGVNVGLAEITNEDSMNLSVLERGAGWTEACGTGACAAAAAAVQTGRVARNTPITVNLPGGPLMIEIDEANRQLKMTGPAVHVFSGTLTNISE